MEMTDSQLIQSVTRMQEELVAAVSDLNRLASEMANTQQISKPSFSSSEEERGQVMKFLFNLQRTGITNMLSADEYIQKRFSFTRAKAREYLFDYIDNYHEIETMLSAMKVAPTTTTEVKKRKGPKPYSEMTPEEIEQAKAKKARSKGSESSSVQSNSSGSSPMAEPAPVAKPAPAPVAEPSGSSQKKTVLKLKKNTEGPKSNAMLIWNSFMNTVRSEMGEGVSYDEVRKKAIEMKAGDPESYKLFSENWTN